MMAQHQRRCVKSAEMAHQLSPTRAFLHQTGRWLQLSR
jgi:hypothetical protein